MRRNNKLYLERVRKGGGGEISRPERDLPLIRAHALTTELSRVDARLPLIITAPLISVRSFLNVSL